MNIINIGGSDAVSLAREPIKVTLIFATLPVHEPELARLEAQRMCAEIGISIFSRLYSLGNGPLQEVMHKRTPEGIADFTKTPWKELLLARRELLDRKGNLVMNPPVGEQAAHVDSFRSYVKVEPDPYYPKLRRGFSCWELSLLVPKKIRVQRDPANLWEAMFGAGTYGDEDELYDGMIIAVQDIPDADRALDLLLGKDLGDKLGEKIGAGISKAFKPFLDVFGVEEDDGLVKVLGRVATGMNNLAKAQKAEAK